MNWYERAYSWYKVNFPLVRSDHFSMVLTLEQTVALGSIPYLVAAMTVRLIFSARMAAGKTT